MGYQEKKQIVLDELEKSLGAVKEEEVEQFVDMICDAQHVGAIDEPAITEHDVLVVGSGSGESVVPLEIMKIAKKYNAKIVHIGSNEHSSMKEYEDLFVRIPCSTKLGLEDEVKSEQVMSSLFEQSLLLLEDSVASMIVEKKQIEDVHALWKMHANLE